MPLSDVKVIGVDPNRRAVLFSAEHGNGRVNCVVSFEALDDTEGASRVRVEDRAAQFARNQPRVVEAADRNYFGNKSEPDGTVLVRTADLQAVPRGVV